MVTLQTRIDPDLKLQCEALFKDLGISTAEAIRLFLTECVNRGGLPFTPIGKRPNAETLAAFNEEEGEIFSDVKDLMKYINKQ